MPKEAPGTPARLVRLAKGFYPVERKIGVLLTGDSLQFADRKQRTVVPLDEVREISLEPWPSSLVAFALWILIPWPTFDLSNQTNLSVRTLSGWHHFKIRRKKDREELLDGLSQRCPNLHLKGVISTVEN